MTVAAAAEAAAEGDAALFARLAELERAEEAAEAAGEGSAGSDFAADTFVPSTPAQPVQGRGAAASHPRLSQLSQLQPAGTPVHDISDMLSTSYSRASVPTATLQGAQQQHQQQQQQQQQQRRRPDAIAAQAAVVQESQATTKTVTQDDGGVGAVGNKLRRVSWADEKSVSGGGGGRHSEKSTWLRIDLLVAVHRHV
jgi:DNA-binding transcriptional MerR regulator